MEAGEQVYIQLEGLSREKKKASWLIVRLDRILVNKGTQFIEFKGGGAFPAILSHQYK